MAREWGCARCDETYSGRTKGTLWPVFFSVQDALICKRCATELRKRIKENAASDGVWWDSGPDVRPHKDNGRSKFKVARRA